MNFKTNLAHLLTINKMSKSELGRRLGVSKQAIDSFLRTDDPRISTCMKIATIFDVSLEELVLKDLTQ